MAGNNDIQGTMSTKIEVDAQQAGEQVENLTNKFKDLTASWKAEEAVAKSNGDTIGAAKARYRGLSESLEVQKEKVAQLKRQQQDLQELMRSGGTVTKEQTDDLKNLDRQLASAAAKVTSLSNQQQRAKNSFDYAKSGLRELKNEYYNNNRAIESNVEKLKAEGQTAEAQKAKLSGLRISLENLSKQQKAAKELADEAARSEGSNSNIYKRRITDYNKISAAIAKTKTESEELNKVMNPPKISGWTMFREKILGVSSAEDRAASMGAKMKGVFSGAFLGSLTGNVLPMLQTQLQGITTNGMKAAQAGMAIQGRWKNIGASASGIKELTAQVTELRTHSNLAVQTINSLQTRFYGMTKSVSQTKALTQGVASLADSMKLSEQQANGFANGLNRIESSGKVTSASLGRLEKQAPGLATQLAKAAGMSQQQFNALVSSGKMTTKQFNSYLEQASKSYDKNAKAFTSSASGSAHSLQQQWAITQATLAKPLVKVEATGLNQLNQALSNKDTQRGLQALATGMATLAVNAAKAIAVLARHQTVVKGVATAVLGLVGAYKGMQIVVSVNETIRGFTKVVSGSSVAMKAFGVATRFMTGPIGIAVIAITALVARFTALYRHDAKFRSFVNGIARSLKNMAKGFVNTGRNILKSAGNLHKNLSKRWSTYWKQRQREQLQATKRQQQLDRQSEKNIQKSLESMRKSWTTHWKNLQRSATNGWKSVERSTQNGSRNVVRWYNNLNRSTSKVVQNMYRQHPKTFQAMYKVIQARTRTWHDLMHGHWRNLGRDLQNEAEDMNRANRRIFSDMYDRLNDLTHGNLDKMISSWKSHMSSIGDAISSGAKSAMHAMAGLANDVLKPFNALMNDIKDGLNWILDKIGASKIGGSWSISVPSYATGTQGNPDGTKKASLALVNDGPGEHYREMFRTADGRVGAFPAKRNFLTFLPKGTSILDGESAHRLAKAFNLPHFANGVGDFFSGLTEKATDAASDVGDFIEKVIEHPVEALENVFKKFVNVSTPIQYAAQLVTSVPPYIAKQAAEWIKKQFQALANPGGAGVERWRPYIIAAFKQLGYAPADWKVNKLLRQIQTESGGNPNAFQHGYVDANTGGNEARGLLQFAGSTWAADALPGHTDWHNGYNEILAAINVLEHGGEGGWGNVGNGHGWANGGLITQHGLYEVGEYNRPEMIIPMDISKRSRAYQLLGEVVSKFKSEEPSSQTTRSDQPITQKEFMSLESRLDKVVGLLAQIAGLSSDQVQAIKDQGTFDTKQFYKKEARDARMRAFG